MGTRADFYVRKDNLMQWLASTAWDGYPDGIDKKVLQSTTEEDFKANLNDHLKDRGDVTLPHEGWPWPWSDSCTTDYAYVFDNGKVMASCFGGALFDPLLKEESDEDDDTEDVQTKMSEYFPDMSHIKNVKLGGSGSGIILIQSTK